MFECEERPTAKLWEIPIPSEKKPDYRIVRPTGGSAPTASPVVELDNALFPRSADRYGHPKAIGDQRVLIPGPFGKLVALRIENEGTEDCWIFATGGNLSTAVRIAASGIRRLEFDTPTRNGLPITVLDLQLHSDIDEPNRRVFIEVE